MMPMEVVALFEGAGWTWGGRGIRARIACISRRRRSEK